MTTRINLESPVYLCCSICLGGSYPEKTKTKQRECKLCIERPQPASANLTKQLKKEMTEQESRGHMKDVDTQLIDKAGMWMCRAGAYYQWKSVDLVGLGLDVR
ncbi:unnamed protein product [Pleuronectes platessa]|uniref:Uncharacterized protein n=1 Tax=Pleuronectes platessa TaxID=8262 RepID=A0A9N7YJT0_PLEPL|nr:unnamed protein product [Pleuronectes platessa]